MPSSWDLEALRAQAVAARSYALSTSRGGGLFDQYPDTRSQVYRGVSAETSRTNAAVARTSGEVLVYRGRVATAYYFSTSGGQTENVEFGFSGGSPVPYLRSVQDPADRISPRYRWAIEYSDAEMARRLRGLVKGRLKSVKVVRTGVSPRVVQADLVGSRGRTRVTGDDLRARLDLPSTWVRFSRG
jgi:stage II sporulation protein D